MLSARFHAFNMKANRINDSRLDVFQRLAGGDTSQGFILGSGAIIMVHPINIDNNL